MQKLSNNEMLGEIMRLNNLGGYNSINAFVDGKLRRYNESAHDFAALFELMFSERDNIMYEKSAGYRVIKTTYGEAREELLRRAATLGVLLEGCEKNSVVGIYMDNSLLWLETLWAVLCCGFCPLLLNKRLDDEALEYALRVSGAGAVISDSKSFSVRTIDSKSLEPSDSAYEPSVFGSDIIVMSSGTSSHVKLCAYSAEEFFFQIRGSYGMIRKCAQVKKHYEGELKLLTFLPFYHIFGLVAVYIWFGFFSRTFVELGDMQPQTIVNTIKRHKVTHVFAVPLFWETVYEQAMRTVAERGEKTVKKLEKGLSISRRLGDVPVLGELFTRLAFREVREEMFGESIIFSITGGSGISPRVCEFFNAIGYNLSDGYGMSEIGIASVELRRSKRLRSTCSVGLPMSGVEYRLNESGELLVKGRAAARYIIEDGERRERAEWFNTRDLARYENGGWYILGRRDDLIIAPGGENLNPNLIEEKLGVEGARGVCLIGDDREGKTVPALLVSVNKYISGERLSEIERELKKRLSELRLSGQIQRLVFISDSLLQGDEFKLNRRRLTADYKRGALAPVVPDRAAAERENDEVARSLTGMMAALLNKSEDEIGYTADFFTELGGSSLDYFAMISQLREQYALPFPTDNPDLTTVKGLHDYITSA